MGGKNSPISFETQNKNLFVSKFTREKMGMDQTFENQLTINTNLLSYSELTTYTEDTYPLIITIGSKKEESKDNKDKKQKMNMQITYAYFT